MKRSFLFWAALAVGATTMAQQADPVLMRINEKNITRSEFEYIYNKNNSNNELDKKSLDEYVDLFVNFKLKVAAAEEAGLDTTLAFKKEFNGYRQQLAKSYLTDASVDEANALLSYNRMKENVEAWHILIRLQPNATDEQVDEAYNKAERARQRILDGEDFATVAKAVSEDPSAQQNGGYLGYFTGMQMVRPFEDAAFALKVGEVSEPVRSNFGFHVIKVTNRRPDIGKVLVAHIFKFLPQNASQEKQNEVKAKMDSIYSLLQKGEDFAVLAKMESEDRGTSSRGGELPWIGLHQTVKEFEDVAFGLEKNEISKPFHSPNGMHIVKMLDRKQLEPFSEKKDEIMRRLARMGEGNKGVHALVERLKKEYGFVLDEAGVASAKATLKSLVELQNDTTGIKKPEAVGNLFTLAGIEHPAQKFVEWINGRVMDIDLQLSQYIDREVLAYENSLLEKKYPDFGHLMQEYRDGILLFEISNNEVWGKASKDEDGLSKFFKENKKDYAWDVPRFRGVILHCSNEEVLKQAKSLLKKCKLPEEQWGNMLRDTLNTDSVTVIKVTRGLYAKGDNKYVDKLVFKSGDFEALADFPCTGVYGKTLKKGPETYKDVRGPVTADYQNFLEEVWIEKLRAKYSVDINQDVLKTVNNH